MRARGPARAALAAALLAWASACATAGGPGSARGGGEGERLYRTHCASCHRLRDPSEHSRERWAQAVEKYGGRAHLSAAERPLVLHYLEAGATDAAR